MEKGEHPKATATEGEDFKAISKEFTISFPKENPPGTFILDFLFRFDLEIIADTLDEPNETILLKRSIVDGTNFEFKRTDGTREGLQLIEVITPVSGYYLTIKDDD